MARPIDVTIRRATRADKRAVLDIVRTIWGGSDYVGQAFDEWVRDRRGGLWLALAGDRAAGLGKLTLLGDREAWLHGLRVAPRWRRRGVGRALIAFRLDRAKQLGARSARLDTADDNVAVRRLMRTFEFKEVDRYTFWGAPARTGARPRVAGARELDALDRLAGRRALLHDERAKRALTREDLVRAIAQRRCLVAGPLGHPRAMALIQSAGERLSVAHLAGTTAPLTELLGGLPAEAKRRGREHVGIVALRRHWAALRRAGYRRRWSGTLLLFEKRL